MILFVLLATVLFSISTVLGTLVPTDTTLEILRDLVELFEPLENVNALSLLLLIFLNNAIKTLGVIILGVVLGVPPLLFLFVNGFMIGVLVSVSISIEGVGLVLAGLLPHGVIEVPLILLAAALGFAVGWQSFKWLVGRDSQVRTQLSRGLKLYLRWVLPGLFIAAVIESFITPWILGMVGNV